MNQCGVRGEAPQSPHPGTPAYYKGNDRLFTVIINKSSIKGHLNFSGVLFIKSLDKR